MSSYITAPDVHDVPNLSVTHDACYTQSGDVAMDMMIPHVMTRHGPGYSSTPFLFLPEFGEKIF
jgi:hypothetical protein